LSLQCTRNEGINLMPSRTAEREAADAVGALRGQVETLMNDTVTPALTAVVDKAQSMGENARAKVEGGAQQVSDRVQAQPLTAIAIAAGVGFLLGMLFRR
jgi:ElaB/YqjD/DUF883 family membrane-anchored ribosome-binding protein